MGKKLKKKYTKVSNIKKKLFIFKVFAENKTIKEVISFHYFFITLF